MSPKMFHFSSQNGYSTIFSIILHHFCSQMMFPETGVPPQIFKFSMKYEASSYWGTTILRDSHHFSSISSPMFLPTKRLRGKPRHGSASASSGSPVSRQPSRRWPEELVSPRRKISGEPWSRDLRQLNGDTMNTYIYILYILYYNIFFNCIYIYYRYRYTYTMCISIDVYL